MPITPSSGDSDRRSSRFLSLPSARRRVRCPPSSVAMPAESYPRYSSRFNASTIESATGVVPRIPTMPHMVPSLVSGFHALIGAAKILGPAGLLDLAPTPERQRVGRDILRNDRTRADISTRTDLYRCDERRIRADKGVVADLRAVLRIAVVIAGDRAGADIGGSADRSVADIGEMVHLGAAADLGGLDLHKIADTRSLLQVGTRAQPCKRPDRDALPHPRTFEMREGVDDCAILDDDTRADDDMRLDDDIAADFGVGGEEHRLRRDQRGAIAHRLLAQPLLHHGLGLGELDAVIDPHHLFL